MKKTLLVAAISRSNTFCFVDGLLGNTRDNMGLKSVELYRWASTSSSGLSMDSVDESDRYGCSSHIGVRCYNSNLLLMFGPQILHG